MKLFGNFKALILKIEFISILLRKRKQIFFYQNTLIYFFLGFFISINSLKYTQKLFCFIFSQLKQKRS
jgi:hypothetical protein